MYIKLGDWEQVALLLQSDLAKIGIRINPVGINNIDDLYTEQGRDNAGNCISQTTFSGGPVPIGPEFLTSHYNFPADSAPNHALTSRSPHDPMAPHVHAPIASPATAASGAPKPTTLTQ